MGKDKPSPQEMGRNKYSLPAGKFIEVWLNFLESDLDKKDASVFVNYVRATFDDLQTITTGKGENKVVESVKTSRSDEQVAKSILKRCDDFNRRWAAPTKRKQQKNPDYVKGAPGKKGKPHHKVSLNQLPWYEIPNSKFELS